MSIFPLTMLFPLLSCIILVISPTEKWTRYFIAVIGTSGICISFLITIYLIFDYYYILKNYITFICIQNFWSWFKVDNLHIVISLKLDKLSLVMLSVITGVGFIIHIYASWYMHKREGYSRFFVYTNLFMFNMMLLILSDNLLLIYFGWEGVSLCSYLLIGFYYFNLKNGIQAIRTFIITRFGDICLLCALFMIYDQYHTLSLSKLLELEPKLLLNSMSYWISIMLLVGSIGKSAQLPFQVWLINAMVGPTPISALIHAATMVTSGVYLINRISNLILITPHILYVLGIIGSITVIIFSCSALFQSNIKKILAYSTVSQIGYMFLAIGSENWDGSIFHLVTHSFFKALLFLAAGSLVQSCYNEQNIFKMGGLYRSIPFVYICFLIGGASLFGLPIITSGFYSKESILSYALIHGNYLFLFSGLIGIFLTTMYTCRMIFVVFHGPQLIIPKIDHDICQYFPLIILLLLSTCFGSQIQLFWLNSIDNNYYQMYLTIISGFIMSFGIWISSMLWLHDAYKISYSIIFNNRVLTKLTRYIILLCHYGWGIDWIYRAIFIRPYLFIIKKLIYYQDPLASYVKFFVFFLNWISQNLIYTENGKLNWYIACVNIGLLIILLIMIINVFLYI